MITPSPDRARWRAAVILEEAFEVCRALLGDNRVARARLTYFEDEARRTIEQAVLKPADLVELHESLVSLGRAVENAQHEFQDEPGLWRHHKGSLYLVLFTAETHNHNGDIDVVYVSLTHGKHVTRPLRRDSRDEDSWWDSVTWPDGAVRHRFAPESAELAIIFGLEVGEPQPKRTVTHEHR